MTLTQKLLKIIEIVHSDGGIAFLKIRATLEDLEKQIDKGDARALQFEQELNHLLRFCELVSKG